MSLLPPLMVLTLFAALLAGFPVAFSIAAVALAFGAAGLAMGAFPPAFLFAIPLRVLGILLNDNLTAIPFFVFIGLLLERSGIAEEMLDAFGRLLAPVRSGLAYAVVIVGAALAATTGIVSASVVAMGLTTLPVMLRYGYSPALASGVILALGTLIKLLFGLRYEYVSAPTEIENRIDYGYPADTNNIEPRLGGATKSSSGRSSHMRAWTDRGR